MSSPVSPLASTIDVMLSRANITTVDAFAELLLSAPTFIANFIRSEAAAAAVAGRCAVEIGTMTDASVVDMGTQTTADDAVDTATAEAMVAEALHMVDEAKERAAWHQPSCIPRSSSCAQTLLLLPRNHRRKKVSSRRKPPHRNAP